MKRTDKTCVGCGQKGLSAELSGKRKVLMAASVASMIDQFNMPNICLLQEMGYEVHVLCNFKEGNTCSSRRIQKLLQVFKKKQIIWHQWDCPRSLWQIKKCIKAFRQLSMLLKKDSFAWIHCHSPIGSALVRLMAGKAGVPVIYTAHGFHFYHGAPLKNWLLYYPAEKALSYWTNVLITVNQEDEWLARNSLRAGCIYRIPGVGVDTEHFQRMPGADRRDFCRMYQIPEHAVILLSVGELNEGKNHRMVIDALAKLSDTRIYYMICGQGALWEELQRYADKLGVGGRIRMPGFVENLSWIYQSADIFVFPSVREGMPVAVMEAMAAGLPCVVSDIRGCKELISARKDSAGLPGKRLPGGYRFSLKQPQQLIAALKMLADHKSLRKECGKYNQRRMKDYDQRIVQQKMKEIYAGMESKNGKSDES